jgi:transposase-like protein
MMPGAMVTGLMVCPTCGSEELEAVTDGEATNFLCPVCRDCWHVELGWVHRVDPKTCPGCQHLDLCLAVDAALT